MPATTIKERMETAIPGRAAIELVSFYEEFRSYYPFCELETKRWFVDNVQPDWWIFDIGANVGYYSILFAQLAHKGRVLSFEPTSTAKMLRENLQHNGIANVDVHDVALGAVTGVHRDRIFRMWGSEGDVQDYPFYRLDDFVAEKKPTRVDCLKIDVDSFDFEVLRGAEQTLVQHNPVIVVELNHALAKRNQTASEVLAWLAQRGYRQALVLDNDNYVFQRDREHLKVAGSASLELVFPPPMRFEETLDAVTGTPLDRLLMTGEFQNEATFRDDRDSVPATSLVGAVSRAMRKLISSGSDDGRLGFSSVAGRAIATPSSMWSYALAVAFDPGVLAKVPAGGSLVMEIEVEVSEGKLGIGIAGADLSSFVSPERTLSAMPGAQRLVITAPADQAKSLAFRNVATEGTRTIFTLVGVRAKAKPPRTT
jgi:FkbM family methyltransferase